MFKEKEINVYEEKGVLNSKIIFTYSEAILIKALVNARKLNKYMNGAKLQEILYEEVSLGTALRLRQLLFKVQHKLEDMNLGYITRVSKTGKKNKKGGFLQIELFKDIYVDERGYQIIEKSW